jgi:SAM-dependent methyltransferase
MSNDDVIKLWDKEWSDYSSVHESGSIIGKWLHSQRMTIIRKMLKNMDKSLTTIDIGCGAGETMFLLRDIGFKHIVGIDLSPHAVEKAIKHGLIENVDIFLMDGSKTTFKDRHFKFGFSEGLWEHFKNPTPFIDEACRISDDYLMVVQPDHFSFFGGLLHWGWKHFSKKGVLEYSFTMDFFIKSVAKNGFVLIAKKGTYLNEQCVMLFRRIQ